MAGFCCCCFSVAFEALGEIQVTSIQVTQRAPAQAGVTGVCAQNARSLIAHQMRVAETPTVRAQ